MSKKFIAIMVFLCALLVAGLAVYGAASEVPPTTVVYVDGINGVDTNDGSSDTKAVATLGKAYELLLAADDGVKTNANAKGYLVICGPVSQGSHFGNTQATAHEHVGTVTYTSSYNGVNYATTKSAKLTLATASTSEELRIQMGGPTVWDAVSVTTSGTKKSVTVYSSTYFEVKASSTVTSTNLEKLFVRGGHAYKATTDDIYVILNAGTYDFVAPSNAEADTSGNYYVTVGGTAVISRLIGGETSSTGGTNASNVITVNTGASVTDLFVVGDTGTVTNSRVVLNGGTVTNLSSRRSGKTGVGNAVTLVLAGDAVIPNNAIAALGSNKFPGTKTLELSGRTNAAETINSIWNAVVIKDGSNITMAAAVPAATTVKVETGSKLTLAAGDEHAVEKVNLNNVVYVQQGGTGDGYSAASPVGSLTDAYTKLMERTDVKTNPQTSCTIVICGPVTQSTNFANADNTFEHVGTVTYTSKYGAEDYTSTAKLTLAATVNVEMRVQMPGPTAWRDVKVTTSGSKASVTVYGATYFEVDASAVVEAKKTSEKLFVRGGYAYKTTTGDIHVILNAGTYAFVAPSNAQKPTTSAGDTTGGYYVTVGGNATVVTLVGGETVSSSAATKASSLITVNAGATVTDLYTLGDTGSVTNSKVVINGGTVTNLHAHRSGKAGTAQNVTLELKGSSVVPSIPSDDITLFNNASKVSGTMTLELSGRTSTAETFNSVWNAVVIKDNSDITMAAVIPDATTVTVEAGSKLSLVVNDDHEVGGEGTVGSSHQHNWVDYDQLDVTADCYTEGKEGKKCDVNNCQETKQENLGYKHAFENGVCTVCGGTNNVVYVKQGGTGNGYSAMSPVGTLEEAYAKLLERTDVGTNPDTTGKIVICGVLTINQHFNYTGTIAHAGTITYSGDFGGESYGALLIHADAKADLIPEDEHRFQLGGPTVMEKLTLDRGTGTAWASLTIYANTSLTMAETVKVVNSNWSSAYVKPIAGLTDQQISTILLSAHRGFQPMGPENSILSYTAAGELGFDYIECDVYMTKDGQLVTIHDATLDRTTNGTGTVTDMTYDEILQYKMDTAAYGYDISQADPSKLYVPTFREYLEICKKYGCKPFIEIKDSRETTLKAIINMALEYFPAKDIVMSCGSLSALKTSYGLNKDLFHHLIWGTQTDEGYTNSINELKEMTNSAGEIYAGIAFNIKDLHKEANYNAAKSWIDKAHAAGLLTCLRGADDMTQVRLMFELGIDYYPTNTTNREKLQQLKNGVVGGYSYSSATGGKIFIRGGSRSGVTSGNISITLLGGMYDMVAPSNAEMASTGNYSVTVGGNAFVSRLIAGETNKTTGDRDSSVVIIKDDAEVRELYLAGDAANVKNLTVSLLGGKVVKMTERRSEKTGTVGNLTLNIADVKNLPDTLSVSNTGIITGTKTLRILASGKLNNSAVWTKLVAGDAAVVTLTGTYPASLEAEGTGKFQVDDQSFAFGTVGTIKEDGAGVELGVDIPYTQVGSGQLQITWYADNNGQKGEALNGTPQNAGKYWVGVSVAEAVDANVPALIHMAVPEQLVSFTVEHVLISVGASASNCTEDGILAHYHCSVCGKDFEDAEGVTEMTTTVDPKDGHDMTSVGASASNCTEDGILAHYHCSVCGKDFEDAEGVTEMTTTVDPKDGHDMTTVGASASNCTEDGILAHYHCSVCGKDFEDAEGVTEMDSVVDPKDGHNMTAHKGTAATCTKDGVLKHYTCDVCEKAFADELGENELESTVDPAKGHKLTKHSAKEPTCTAKGSVKHYTCSRCDGVFADSKGEKKLTSTSVAAKGHDLEKVEAVAPTCTESGIVEHYKCTRCGRIFADAKGKEGLITKVDPAKGHALQKVEAVEPTATTAGNIAHYICTSCQQLFADAEGRLPLSAEDVVIEPLGNLWASLPPSLVSPPLNPQRSPPRSPPILPQHSPSRLSPLPRSLQAAIRNPAVPR